MTDEAARPAPLSIDSQGGFALGCIVLTRDGVFDPAPQIADHIVAFLAEKNLD